MSFDGSERVGIELVTQCVVTRYVVKYEQLRFDQMLFEVVVGGALQEDTECGNVGVVVVVEVVVVS